VVKIGNKMLEARSVTGGQKFKEVQEFKSSRVQRGSRVQKVQGFNF
jgi:hypothetical protein